MLPTVSSSTNKIRYMIETWPTALRRGGGRRLPGGGGGRRPRTARCVHSQVRIDQLYDGQLL